MIKFRYTISLFVYPYKSASWLFVDVSRRINSRFFFSCSFHANEQDALTDSSRISGATTIISCHR